MKNHHKPNKNTQVYETPRIYTCAFCFLLTAWTLVSLFLLFSRKNLAGWSPGQLLMIAFVLAYTWYFSLDIIYRIRIEGDGSVQMISFRRYILTNAKGVEAVQGPRLAFLPFGFIRFRLKREKIYLFAVIADQALQSVLVAMRKANPDLKIKGL